MDEHYSLIFLALNHKNTTSITLDESASSTAKNLTMDNNKISRQSSTSSNNLLKPDSHIWTDNTIDIDALRNKSQSLSNIAGN